MKSPFSILALALMIFSSAALVAGQTQPAPTQTPIQPAPTQPAPTQPAPTKPETTTPATPIATETPIVNETQTATKTVQNADGTYTVIEYPLKQETVVTLTPVAGVKYTGAATILRDDNGTRIVLNMKDVPADVTALNLYAVDEGGAVTSLGPVVLSNGVGKFSATTPLTKFMLIASPEPTLTTYDPNTKVFFRSAVPEGLAVIPHTMNPVGEKVSATTADATTATTIAPTETVATTYTAPMLNIPAYKKGDDTKMKINLSGSLTGARANVFITPRKDGPTEVKLRFHELKEAPTGKTFTVWAISPDNKFVKLGQIVNVAGRNEAEIKSEVALPDFGLLITTEDTSQAMENPMGPRIGFVEIVP